MLGRLQEIAYLLIGGNSTVYEGLTDEECVVNACTRGKMSKSSLGSDRYEDKQVDKSNSQQSRKALGFGFLESGPPTCTKAGWKHQARYLIRIWCPCLIGWQFFFVVTR